MKRTVNHWGTVELSVFTPPPTPLLPDSNQVYIKHDIPISSSFLLDSSSSLSAPSQLSQQRWTLISGNSTGLVGKLMVRFERCLRAMMGWLCGLREWERVLRDRVDSREVSPSKDILADFFWVCGKATKLCSFYFLNITLVTSPIRSPVSRRFSIQQRSFQDGH